MAWAAVGAFAGVYRGMVEEIPSGFSLGATWPFTAVALVHLTAAVSLGFVGRLSVGARLLIVIAVTAAASALVTALHGLALGETVRAGGCSFVGIAFVWLPILQLAAFRDWRRGDARK